MCGRRGGGRAAGLLRWCTLLSGLVESLFFTGMVFGWASLVFVLKADGYFAGHCANATGEGNYAAAAAAAYTDCRGQDEHLSWVLSVASISNTIIRFPIGYVFDRCGTTVTRLIAIFMYTAGTLTISLSNAETSMLLYPAVSCLIISGGLLYVTNAQVGNLFDSYRSTVITIYNGAFDSSAVVFLIIKLLYERGVSLCSSFLFLASCSVLLILRTIFLMPRGHIPYPPPENYTYGVSCPGRRRGKREEEEEGKEEIKEADGKKNLQEDRAEDDGTSALQLIKKTQHDTKQEEVASFRSCVLSWLFLWHLVWCVTILFCHFIFLSTVNPTLTRLANNDQTLVSHYTNAFALIQLCGVLYAPMSGLIMDRHKRRPLAPGETKREADLCSSTLALFLTSLQCFLFFLCFTVPVLPLQYITFILHGVNSAFFYGGHQAFVSMAFPMTHFGKISGVALSVSALALLLQFPVLHLVQHKLLGDPLYVHVGVTLVSLLAFIHPAHVSLYCSKLTKQRKTQQKRSVQLPTRC